MQAVARDPQKAEWEIPVKKGWNREPIQVCILSLCFTPQLSECTLEFTAVGQADFSPQIIE